MRLSGALEALTFAAGCAMTLQSFFTAMGLRTLFLLSIILGLSAAANAQVREADSRSAASDMVRKPEPGSPEEELLHRAEIRRGEEAHKETLERAREGAEIVSHLRQSFEANSLLGAHEIKQLERVEKLAKKIRGSAGGSDDDESLQNLPREVGSAIRQLAEAVEDLKKKVEKTSRLVTSAGVIQRSNEVIQLVKHIRTLFR